MKHLFTIIATSFVVTMATAQGSKPTGLTEEFQPGYIITYANEKTEGYIKDALKNKSAVVFATSAGDKKNYSTADVKEFAIKGERYVSHQNDFYKVITTGGKGSLYQKVTDNNGKVVYVGSEPTVVTTTEGKKGNYYLQVGNNGKLALVTEKNFEAVFATYCADCPALQEGIKTKQYAYTDVSKAVEQYNSCK